MEQEIEINPGEILVKFKSPTPGKLSFKQLGISEDNLIIDSGFLRIVFDMEGIGEHSYFQVPTIEVAYDKNVAKTHWQCDFNEKTILDKIDHHGQSTVVLLDRKTISKLEHRHENKLILHAEFPEKVQLNSTDSYINFFK